MPNPQNLSYPQKTRNKREVHKIHEIKQKRGDPQNTRNKNNIIILFLVGKILIHKRLKKTQKDSKGSQDTKDTKGTEGTEGTEDSKGLEGRVI